MGFVQCYVVYEGCVVCHKSYVLWVDDKLQCVVLCLVHTKCCECRGHKSCVFWVDGKLKCVVSMGCVQCTQSVMNVSCVVGQIPVFFEWVVSCNVLCSVYTMCCVQCTQSVVYVGCVVGHKSYVFEWIVSYNVLCSWVVLSVHSVVFVGCVLGHKSYVLWLDGKLQCVVFLGELRVTGIYIRVFLLYSYCLSVVWRQLKVSYL